jgi:nicotinamidase-related amidase
MSGTALLVMDFQDEIVANFDVSALVPRVQGVLAAARDAGMPVIFVVVGFRPGYPEVAAGNKSFGAIKSSGRLVQPKVIEALKPQANEPVVTKRRVSALGETDLATILRGLDCRHIVLSGISTSGVVLSTTRAAADLDYEITILADCCADGDAEVHAVLMGKVFPRQARVIDAATFLAELAA